MQEPENITIRYLNTVNMLQKPEKQKNKLNAKIARHLVLKYLFTYLFVYNLILH